jgi:hypothetical protein
MIAPLTYIYGAESCPQAYCQDEITTSILPYEICVKLGGKSS